MVCAWCQSLISMEERRVVTVFDAEDWNFARVVVCSDICGESVTEEYKEKEEAK